MTRSDIPGGVRTVVTAGNSGVKLTQTDTYNERRDGWVTHIEVEEGHEDQGFSLYHVAGYCNGSGAQQRWYDAASGYSYCRRGDTTVTFTEPHGSDVYIGGGTWGHRVVNFGTAGPAGDSEPTSMTSEIVWRRDGTWPTAPGSPGGRPAYYGTDDPNSGIGGYSPDTNLTQCSCADPINTATGELWSTATDLELPGRLPIEATRTYSSLRAGQPGLFGRGWASPWDMHLDVNVDEEGDGTATITHENGARTVIPAVAGEGFVPDPDTFATLRRDPWEGNYEYVRRSNETFVFDPAGNLTEIRDRNGEATTLTREWTPESETDPQPDPVIEALRIQSSDGRTLVADLNPDGTVATLTGPEGRAVSYAYDTDDNLVEVTDARGKSWTYQYDAQGLMTHETDPTGATTETEYDSEGRAVSQDNPRGGTTTFDYTADPDTGMSSATTVTDPTGVTTLIQYEHGQQVSKTTDPLGDPATWTYEYDNKGNRTLAVDPVGDRTYFAYDALGNLTRQTDPSGSITRHTYNLFHQVLTTIDPRGYRTVYEYDDDGNLLSFRKPRGGIDAVTEYVRDPDHPADIRQVIDPDGRTRDLTYDDAGFEISSATGDGATTTTTRNAYGQPLTRTTPRGNAPGATPADFTTTYEYDDGGLPEAIEDPLGHTTTYAYDAKGRVREVSAPDDGTTTTTYDPDDKIASVTDPNEDTTTYEYDDAGRLVAETTARDARTSYTYDSHGNLATTTRPRGNRSGATAAETAAHTTTIQRDLAGREVSATRPNPTDPSAPLTTETDYVEGRVASITNPAGEQTTYGYDLSGNLTSVTDATDATTYYEYDEWGSPFRTKLPSHNVATTTTYSLAGLVAGASDPEGGTTTYTYDDAGRLATTVGQRGNCGGCNPAEHTSTTTYDLDGNVLTETDPLDHTTTFDYDAAGRPTQVTNAAGQSTHYSYDEADRLKTITAADGGVTTYGYDAVGRLTSVQTPRLKTTTYGYNADGAPISRTDPLGRQRTWSYDLDGNLTSAVTARGNASPAAAAAGTITYAYDTLDRTTSATFGDGSPTVSYTYDRASRPVTIADAAGTQTRAYDDAGRITSLSRTGNTWSYTYNRDGTIATVTRPDNSLETWTYDLAARATKVVAPNGTTTFGYDPAGNLTWTDHPNATREAQTYDPAGNLTKVATSRKSDGVEIVSHTVTRDAVNNPTQVVTKRGTTTSTRSFLYDPNQRVKSVCYTALTTCTTTNATQAWTYDPNGNRLTEKNGTGTGTTTTYTYDNADQLTTRKIGTAAATTLTYDADGNLLTDAANGWTYDLQNRVKTSTASGTASTWQRDHEGNLLKQTTGSSTTNFTWDINRDVPQLAAVQAGSTTTSYRYDPAGRPANLASGSTRQTIAHDLIGAPTDLVSASRAIVRSYDYTPFGTSRAAAGGPGTPSGVPSHLQYGAMLTANPAAPSNYITRARVYDPATARWTGTDPASADASRPYDSTYSYVGNQPTLYLDALGEICNLNPFSSSENACGIYDHVANTLSGDNPAAWTSNFLVNVGRGATGFQTDALDELISPGSSCTVTDEGVIARAGQIYGIVVPALVSGGSRIPVAAGGADAAASSQILLRSPKVLQSKFKHASDFGVTGNYSKSTAAEFSAAIHTHINGAGTVAIQGTYRGQAVTHYLDPNTGLNVIVRNGEFVSGWRLSEDQFANILRNGSLGGG